MHIRVRISQFCPVLLTAFAFSSAAHAEGFEFYGQLNFGILNYDDGVESESYLVNNSNSTTQIGFNYDVPMASGDGLKLNFETGFGIVSSDGVNQIDGGSPAIDFDKTDIRRFQAIYSSEQFGTFSFGQGSMATDGAAGADFSGTTVISGSSITDLNGGQFLRQRDGSLSDIRLSDVFSNLGGSRRFRVRYDSPSFSGFGVSAAYGREVLKDDDDNDYYDIALTYGNDTGDFETQAYLGYRWKGDDRITVGSIAAIHTPTGTNGALAAGQEDGGGQYYWIKAGIKQDWFDIGTTALSVDYYSGEDFETSGSSSESWAVSVVQKFSENWEAYAIYRENSYDDDLTDYYDGQSVMVGGRWTF